MTSLFRRVGVGLLLWVAVHAHAADPALQWLAGGLPPFAWQEGTEAKGFACDLVRAMAKKLGRREQFAFYPWARAVKLAAEKPNYGIFPLARTPDREHEFLWLIPLVRVDYIFLELKKEPLAHALEGEARLAELRSRRVGVLRGSPIIKNLQAQHFAHIAEGQDYQELLRMLASGLVDAVYAGRPMILASVATGGYGEGLFRVSASLGDATLYMAASKGLGDAEAGQWRSAYEALVKDGTVLQLQKKYGLAKAPGSGGR